MIWQTNRGQKRMGIPNTMHIPARIFSYLLNFSCPSPIHQHAHAHTPTVSLSLSKCTNKHSHISHSLNSFSQKPTTIFLQLPLFATAQQFKVHTINFDNSAACAQIHWQTHIFESVKNQTRIWCVNWSSELTDISL